MGMETKELLKNAIKTQISIIKGMCILEAPTVTDELIEQYFFESQYGEIRNEESTEKEK